MVGFLCNPTVHFSSDDAADGSLRYGRQYTKAQGPAQTGTADNTCAIMFVVAAAFLFCPIVVTASAAGTCSVDSPRGYSLLKTPIFNKFSSFSESDRHKLGLNGLIPAGDPLSLEMKVQLVIQQVRSKVSPIEKYIYMQTIQDSDETLYYAALSSHLTELMPIVYTPTVGEACQKWSHITRFQPRGLYLSVKNRGNIASILAAHPQKNIKVIVVTDGERILGLGDLGANGMGIPVGKLALYTACAGIPPQDTLPVHIDVGTNTPSILEDPFYQGLRQRRDRSAAYDELIAEFFEAAQAAYGKNVLIQFEDFGNSNAFRLLSTFRSKATTFNDDIQGTASVVLGGLISSLKSADKQKISDHVYLFFGAGEAGVGIADLVAASISRDSGVTLEEARRNIWLVDSRGLITSSTRDVASLEHHKQPYARPLPSASDVKSIDLLSAIKLLKPSALIGVSAQGATFTEEVVREMARLNNHPVIFALSNPTTKSECSAEEAYTWSDGRAIFASGSPFDEVTLPDGRHFIPGQGNNV